MKAENVQIPEYARDLKANLTLALGVEDLTKTQIWGSAIAAAVACRNQTVISHIKQLATTHLDKKALDAARGAASIMSANNIYWRFWYLVDDRDYIDIKPDFSETIFREHGVPEVDFECYVLAVSIINNCHGCLKVHSRKLLKLGFTHTQIMHVIRIAAVIHSFAVTMAGEGNA